jgi:hypothetical protein
MMGGAVPVSREVIGELYELIGVFPYFQSAHILLLKGLHDNSDVKFESQLRNSAIHVADREILYYILNPRSSDEIIADAPAGENTVHEDVADDRVQTVIEEAVNSNQLIDEIEGLENRPVPHDESRSQPKWGHSVLVSAEAEYDETSEVIQIDESNDNTADDQPFYSDPGIYTSDNSDGLLEFETGSDDQETVGEEGQREEASSTDEKVVSKQLQSELIEKFIIANPRIEPSREKVAGPLEDISKPVPVEEGGFVTETLARIYIGQGYYSKAIDIYEKLSLKFPEKSSYFATQIEKVKEYLKN